MNQGDSNHDNAYQHDSVVSDLYQQRKNQQKMPNELKSSLQNTLREQLKAEQLNNKYKKNRSSYLRHPAFALAFSLVLVVGVLLNNWTDVEQKLTPLPEMKPEKTLAPLSQADLVTEPEPEPAPNLKPENTSPLAPENIHDNVPDSLLKRSEPPITDVASSAEVLVMQPPNTRQTTQQATQIVQGMQKPEAYSTTPEPKHKLAAKNRARVSKQKERQQRERLAESQYEQYQEVERISISAASKSKSQLPPESEIYLLEIKVINKQQIMFTDCYEVNYYLSASLSTELESILKPQPKPKLKIGDRFTLIENPDELLARQLDSWLEKLKPAPTGTTCD